MIIKFIFRKEFFFIIKSLTSFFVFVFLFLEYHYKNIFFIDPNKIFLFSNTNLIFFAIGLILLGVLNNSKSKYFNTLLFYLTFPLSINWVYLVKLFSFFIIYSFFIILLLSPQIIGMLVNNNPLPLGVITTNFLLLLVWGLLFYSIGLLAGKISIIFFNHLIPGLIAALLYLFFQYLIAQFEWLYHFSLFSKTSYLYNGILNFLDLYFILIQWGVVLILLTNVTTLLEGKIIKHIEY